MLGTDIRGEQGWCGAHVLAVLAQATAKHRCGTN